MRTTRNAVVLSVVLVFAAGVLGAMLFRTHRHHDELSAKYKRQLTQYVYFCTKVANTMHNLDRAFQSQDARRQEEARSSFYDSTVAFSNASSIVLCVNESQIPEYPLGCSLSNDYACLSTAARRFETAIRSYIADIQ